MSQDIQMEMLIWRSASEAPKRDILELSTGASIVILRPTQTPGTIPSHLPQRMDTTAKLGDKEGSFWLFEYQMIFLELVAEFCAFQIF